MCEKLWTLPAVDCLRALATLRSSGATRFCETTMRSGAATIGDLSGDLRLVFGYEAAARYSERR